jgi:hypothetical protein
MRKLANRNIPLALGLEQIRDLGNPQKLLNSRHQVL